MKTAGKKYPTRKGYFKKRKKRKIRVARGGIRF